MPGRSGSAVGGVALFTVAAFSSLPFSARICTAPGSVSRWPSRSLHCRWRAAIVFRACVCGIALATGGAATLLVLALFLPWQELCYERDGELDLSRDAASQRTAGRPHRDPWQRSWRSRSCSWYSTRVAGGVDARARGGAGARCGDARLPARAAQRNNNRVQGRVRQRRDRGPRCRRHPPRACLGAPKPT